MKNALLTLWFFLAACALPAVAQNTAQRGAYSAGISQEGVQTNTQTVQAQIAAIIAQAKLNGIATADAEALRPILQRLGTLTNDQMQAVINALKAAGTTASHTAQQEGLTEAAAQQQSIANHLFALAGALSARQARLTLPRDMAALLSKQLGNLRLSLRLQLLPPKGNEQRLQVVGTNQHAIADQSQALVTHIKQLIADLPATEAAPFKAALDTAENGNPSLTTAALDAANTATAGNLTLSIRNQATVRDTLLAAIRSMNSQLTTAEKLAEMSQTLELIIADQTDLIDATVIPNVDTTLLVPRQTTLADEIGILQNLNAAIITPELTAELGLGRGDMQAAAGQLSLKDTGPLTVKKEKDALISLQKARALLALIMKTQAQKLADAATAIAQAQQQVAQAQQALAAKSAPAASQQLKAAAKSATAAAANLPPAAQKAAQQAAAAAATAAASADQAKTSDAQKAAQQAAAALAAAAAAVAQDQANLAQQSAASQSDASDQAAQSLAAAQAATDQAAKAAQDKTATQAQKTAAAQAAQAASAQAANDQKAANAATPTPQGAQAQQSIQNANQALGKAADAAQKGQTADTQQNVADAKAALAQAASAQAAQAAAAQAAAQAAADQAAAAQAAQAAATAAQSLASAQAAADAASAAMKDGSTPAQQAAAAQAAAQAAASAAADQAAANASSQAGKQSGTQAQQDMKAAASAAAAAAKAAQSGQSAAAGQNMAQAQASLAAAAAAQASAAAAQSAAATNQDQSSTATGNQMSGDNLSVNGGISGPKSNEPKNQITNSNKAGGSGQVVTGISPRDRDAITEAQSQKTPPEFTPLVRQYLKNLADGVTP